MRILHAHSGNLFGGVETMQLGLARYANADVEHAFALCFEGRLSSELESEGRAVEFVGNVRWSRPWTVIRARRAFQLVLRRNPPDAVVVHSAWSHSVFAPPTVSADIPLVHFLHAPPSGPPWLERRARRKPPALVLCNSRHTCSARDRLFPGLPSAVVHPPVPPSQTTLSAEQRVALRGELGVPQGAVVLIQVARLEAWKGQELLLDALAEIPDASDWRCCIVGGAQRDSERHYLGHLQARATSLGIDERVAFLGERTDVPKLLQAADIFCHPNTTPEPFGIVFVEALHAGLPVVATAMGGPLEIVTDATGILAEPRAHSVRAALEALIGDAERRERMRQSAPARARELCDPERQARAFTEAIRTTVHRHTYAT